MRFTDILTVGLSGYIKLWPFHCMRKKGERLNGSKVNASYGPEIWEYRSKFLLIIEFFSPWSKLPSD
jgi:hypothetical protein